MMNQMSKPKKTEITEKLRMEINKVCARAKGGGCKCEPSRPSRVGLLHFAHVCMVTRLYCLPHRRWPGGGRRHPLSVCLSVRPSVCLSVCLSVYLSHALLLIHSPLLSPASRSSPSTSTRVSRSWCPACSSSTRRVPLARPTCASRFSTSPASS
jgi:hypothetical protein